MNVSEDGTAEADQLEDEIDAEIDLEDKITTVEIRSATEKMANNKSAEF